jgi:hypothetical protein
VPNPDCYATATKVIERDDDRVRATGKLAEHQVVPFRYELAVRCSGLTKES